MIAKTSIPKKGSKVFVIMNAFLGCICGSCAREKWGTCTERRGREKRPRAGKGTARRGSVLGVRRQWLRERLFQWLVRALHGCERGRRALLLCEGSGRRDKRGGGVVRWRTIWKVLTA